MTDEGDLLKRIAELEEELEARGPAAAEKKTPFFRNALSFTGAAIFLLFAIVVVEGIFGVDLPAEAWALIGMGVSKSFDMAERVVEWQVSRNGE